MPDILHRIGIKASPEEVYAALTDQEGLAGWWTRETRAEPRVGACLVGAPYQYDIDIDL